MQGMKTLRRKQILISVPMCAYQHRQGFEGILRYVKENRCCNWSLITKTDVLPNPESLDVKPFDGALVYTENDVEWDHALSTHIPTVLFDPFRNVNPFRKTKPTTTTIITYDYEEEGRAAAQYFMKRNYKNFAYVPSVGKILLHDRYRQIGFSGELMKHGFSCKVYRTSKAIDSDRIYLSRWLSTLPRTTGIFCVRDARALEVITAAKSANLSVPDHLAVLGFDNDEPLCETSAPQLSSISANVQILGFEAARQLDLILSGRGGGVLLYKPKLQTVTRASTATDANGNLFVSRALDWMRAHLAENPNVDSVAMGIGCSARFLQGHFQKALGCSIGNKLKELKIEAAISMLKASEKNLGQIAYECGFGNASYLCRCMRETTRRTPNEFR